MDPALLNTTDHDLDLMHAAYVGKVNALVAAGRDGLAHELAEAFLQESAAGDRVAAPVPSRARRTWLRRFDS